MVIEGHDGTRDLANELKARVDAAKAPVLCTNRPRGRACYQSVVLAGSSFAGTHVVVLHIHFNRPGWQNELWDSLAGLPQWTHNAIRVQDLKIIVSRVRFAFGLYQDYNLRSRRKYGH